ncbi:MAG: YetF domain-containing protein [Ornithinimicrobium sp.]
MIYDSIADLLAVLVVGSLAYAWLVLLLRVSGKRTLAQLNAFDFVVTVALGSTLASVTMTGSIAWAEGATALTLLAALQFVAAASSSRFPWVRRALTSEPTVLLRDGVPIENTMRAERITEDSLCAAVRGSGVGGLDLVAAVVLETNGGLSVVPRSASGDGTALPARQVQPSH